MIAALEDGIEVEDWGRILDTFESDADIVTQNWEMKRVNLMRM